VGQLPDGEEGEESRRAVIGVPIERIREGDHGRPDLSEAMDESGAQIVPIVAGVSMDGFGIGRACRTGRRRRLDVCALPVCRQERLEAAVRKAEEVLGANIVATEHVEGSARLPETALPVGDVLDRSRPWSAGLVDHGLDVPVAGGDEHHADRPTTREHALDETAGAERLVVGMWGDDD
jgi:hypothetical protein